MKSYRKNRIPQIIFGCDAAKETGKELQNQCVTRCLIATDKGVRAAGLVDPILASLDACGISYIIFDDVKPETPDTVCLELAETIRNNQLDGVLAIGGGSAIDTAKAAAMIPCLPQPIEDLHEYGGTGTLMKNSYVRNIRFIAMPTTSGTGAEITCSSVVLDTKRHLKYSFMNPSMSPDLAIIDPMLTVGMPPRPSAVVGLDVLCHATENLLGAQQNDYSDMLMLECIKRVWKWLPVVFFNSAYVQLNTPLLSTMIETQGWTNEMLCNLIVTMGNFAQIPAYLICLALGGRMNKKKMAYLSIACFLVGGLLIIPCSTSIYLVLLCRFIVGFGSGILILISTAILPDFFEGKELSNVIGLVLAGSGFWGFVFSNVSGFVGGKFGWKIAYLLHLYAVIPLILFL